MKYHALLVIFEKGQNLNLSSAANYIWRFKGYTIIIRYALTSQQGPPGIFFFTFHHLGLTQLVRG